VLVARLTLGDRAIRQGLLAGLLASLVLFGPALCWGQPQPADEQVKFAADVEKAKGHLLASRELYARGERAFAAIHAAHPVQELWSLLRGPLSRASTDLASRVGAILEKPGQEIDAKVPTRRYEDTVKQVSALLDEAVRRVVPAEVRQSPILRAKVILALMEAVEEEYEEGFKEGRIAQVVEYQDAYGFFRRGQVLYRDFASQIQSKAPEAAKNIDGALATLAKGFGGVMPPATPVAMETVKKSVEQITTELAKAAGVQ
jgi:hypothetical protein